MNHASASPNNKIDTSKLAILVTLASETFFFGTLISAYLLFRSTATNYTNVQLSFSRLAVPLANTLLLMLSALVVYQGLRAIRHDRTEELKRWFTLALVMGLAFVGGQAFEYLSTGIAKHAGAGFCS